MKTLYLLRHKRSHIHGPYPIEELSSVLKEAPFQDWEICASLSVWVRMEDEELLKQHYSDVWKTLLARSK